MDRVEILGVNFDNVTMDEAVSRAMELVESGMASIIVTPNSEIAYDCLKNKDFGKLINDADLIVHDGAGVVLASKILKKPLKQKVAGVELAEKLLWKLAEKGKRLFLLGAKPGVAEIAAQKMREKVPDLNICGVCDGYFKSDEVAVHRINAANPDVVFVCLGSPKQELWMRDNAPHIVPCTMMGLGGTIDIFAGEAKRAPDIFIKLNLEWLHRLIKQPSRLGRMMRLPAYLFTAVRFRLTGNLNSREGI